MFNSKFYEDAEELSRTLDKLAREHNRWFVGTSRHDPITLQDYLDAVTYSFSQGRRVILSFTDSLASTKESRAIMGESMAELAEIMDRYNLYGLHSEDTGPYNEFRRFLRRIDHRTRDWFWRVFAWILEKILS